MFRGRKNTLLLIVREVRRRAESSFARTWLPLLIAAGLYAFGTAESAGQQIHVETPLVGVQDSFYENFGTGWGFGWQSPNGGMFMNPGLGVPWAPGFGSGAGAGFGFGVRGGGGGFSFGLNAASGSHRSISMSAPSVTISNGGTGFIQDVTVYPFVTGLVPVVGYSVTSPFADRIERLRAGEQPPPSDSSASTESGADRSDQDGLSRQQRGSSSLRSRSTAESGDISVADIRRQQQLEDRSHDDELARLVDEAHEALRAGRLGAARVRFQQAAGFAQGEQKQQLLRQLELLTPRK